MTPSSITAPDSASDSEPTAEPAMVPSTAPVVEPGSYEVPTECLVAARAADAKSGESTTVLAMGDLLGLTDAFVIASGRNTRQVKTIVDEVERVVKVSSRRSPERVEGTGDARWVLMDYGDFLVHVFLDEAREFYDLEHLWADAPRIEWAEALTP